jgi:hypothetical protein
MGDDVKKDGAADPSTATGEEGKEVTEGKDKLPEHVPYDRFKEKVAETNAEKVARAAADQRAERAELQLEALRQQEIDKLAAERQAKEKPPITDEEFRTMYEDDPVGAFTKYVAQREAALVPAIREAVSRQLATEQVRKEVIAEFPEILNPADPFTKDVATYLYSRPHLRDNPEGLRIATDAIARKIEKEKAKSNSERETIKRKERGEDAAGIEGVGRVPSTEKFELDDEGKSFAAKLGVDPEKLAARLKETRQIRQGRK